MCLYSTPSYGFEILIADFHFTFLLLRKYSMNYSESLMSNKAKNIVSPLKSFFFPLLCSEKKAILLEKSLFVSFYFLFSVSLQTIYPRDLFKSKLLNIGSLRPNILKSFRQLHFKGISVRWTCVYSYFTKQ